MGIGYPCTMASLLMAWNIMAVGLGNSNHRYSDTRYSET